MNNPFCKFLVRLVLLPVVGVLVGVVTSNGQPEPANKAAIRQRYQIELKLDFDARSYTGTERVRWVNRSGQSSSVLFFHLYSNLRPDQLPGLNGNAQSIEAEEPRIQITAVRSVANNTPLTFSTDDQGTILRVNLREVVPPGQSTEVVITFKGSVPEVDPDETGLTTHVIKQVSAALRGEREVRRPRDINFRCRGVMLLGTSYPVLAVNDDNEWLRKVESTVGDMIFNEVADYEVKVISESGIAVFTSAAADTAQASSETEGRGTRSTTFAGTGLRDFAIVAGRTLRSEQIQVGETTVRSIFVPEHERMGKRVLTMAADSLKVFRAKFGPLPFKSINIAEAPLVAGLGSTEFAGMDVIASAFYVDFDSPAMRNLPELIREQRSSVEDSLEWSVAHLIAHQWWGAAVGNDPAREPVLDEAMASYSALQYFRETYGELKATAVLEDQLRGVYRVYRTLGGDDMNADRPARDYKNTFQYAAIVSSKGALMFVQLQQLLGEQKLLTALRNYYQANLLEIADLDDLRAAVIAEAPIDKRRVVARTFSRWLASKKGDEDIAKPDQELATSIGLPSKVPEKSGDRSALNAFARLGKFFWQQMTRIR